MVEAGEVRLIRAGAETRLDTPVRMVRPGERVILISGERRAELKIEALGERRRPASEARELCSVLETERA
jgi:ribosome-associated heat shock protein Hsp15